MKKLAVILTMLVSMSQLACSSSPDTRYLDSRVLPGLEIPPDMTVGIADGAFELPANITANDGSTDTKGAIPVLANVDSIKLEGSGDFYWLSIEAPLDNLYALIKNFWASEGFALAMDEPVIGIMETEWVFKEEGGTDMELSWLARLFKSDDLSDSQDQYRTRIAVDEESRLNRVYIVHRGTEYIYKLDKNKAISDEDGINQWKFRPANPELEVEMLSRLMIYLGLQKSQVNDQLAGVSLFAPRATLHTDYADDGFYIRINDVFSRAWNRTLYQLERMDMEVVSKNSNSGIGVEGLIRIKSDVDVKVKKSGFFNLFSNETKTVKKEFNLVLSKDSHDVTRLQLETVDGDVDHTAEGIALLNLLYSYLK